MPRPNYDVLVKPKFLYSSGEVCRMLRVGLKTVYHWVNEGILPAARMPRRGNRLKGTLRFTHPELMAFIQRHGLPTPGLMPGLEPPVLRNPDECVPVGPEPSPEAPRPHAAPTCREAPCQDTYTPLEIADLLGVNKDTVRRWIDLGKLAGYRLHGDERRVPRECLVAFMNAKNLPLDLLDPSTKEKLCTNQTPATH
jgi:excisionase family DNA binding protein